MNKFTPTALPHVEPAAAPIEPRTVYRELHRLPNCTVYRIAPFTESHHLPNQTVLRSVPRAQRFIRLFDSSGWIRGRLSA